MQELYISVDVETDGPIPGPHSMLSLGAAAFLPSGEMDAETFSGNLEVLDGATGHPETMKWWNQTAQSDAWAACRVNPRPAGLVMLSFLRWVRSLSDKYNAKPVFVAYPAGFDFTFVYWYLVKFLGDEGRELFSFSALDIKTYSMAILKTPFRQTVKSNMPGRWFDDAAHMHVALDDAVEQGRLFCRMLSENLNSDPD